MNHTNDTGTFANEGGLRFNCYNFNTHWRRVLRGPGCSDLGTNHLVVAVRTLNHRRNLDGICSENFKQILYQRCRTVPPIQYRYRYLLPAANDLKHGPKLLFQAIV
jgi:hypothetical protein